MSSDLQWEGPVSILRDDPPMTEPGLLSPACLDPEILHDTEHALQNLEGCAALKQALRDVVGQFNDPLPGDYLPHPFTWVYNYILPAEDALAATPNANLNAQLYVHGHASLELTPILPDVGAVVALAAPDNNPYWLGLVTRLTRTRVFVKWLDKDDKGKWNLLSSSEEGQPLSTIIAHDVSLSLDMTMRPPLHQHLLSTHQQWNKSTNTGTTTNRD